MRSKSVNNIEATTFYESPIHNSMCISEIPTNNRKEELVYSDGDKAEWVNTQT